MITVKAARVNRGYSQKYCAQKLGVSRNTYIKYENGVIPPSVNRANEIAELLGARLDDIIFLPKMSS